jgi:hypothetical protein
MDGFAESLGYWLDFQATVTTTRKAFQVSILLQDFSLCRAFLVFANPSSTAAIFAIDGAMSAAAPANETILITTSGYAQNCISISCPSVFDAQLLRTQIVFCSRISRHSAPVFTAENAVFLSAHGRILHSIPSGSPPIPILPVFNNLRSYSSWRQRAEVLNVPFFSRRDPIRVTFFTWNVEQKPASRELSRSVAFLFSDENDLVVVGLQEIDFSMRALVLGSSLRTGTFDRCRYKQNADGDPHSCFGASSLWVPGQV